VSEKILNGTSAQLGYTVPFTLVHAGKYRTDDKLKMTENTEIKYNTEKANNSKHSKTKLPQFSRLFMTLGHGQYFYRSDDPTSSVKALKEGG